MNRTLDAEAYVNRSGDSYDSWQFDQAIIFCKRALTMNPNDYDAHFQWGSNLNRMGSSGKSKKHKSIICRDPINHRAYSNYGGTLENENRLPEAEIQYRKSLEIDPLYRNGSHNLAIVLTKQGKYTEALEQCEKDRRDHGEMNSYNSYGYLKILLGKYEEAIESFDESINRRLEENLPFFNKSMALYCLGKNELAVETLREGFEKICGSRDFQQMMQNDLPIYKEELSRFEKLSESDDLGEIKKEQLVVIIKAIQFIIDSLNQELMQVIESKKGNES